MQAPDPILDHVLRELAIGPRLFYQLFCSARSAFPGHDPRDLRNGLNRVLDNLKKKGHLRADDPLPGHYALVHGNVGVESPRAELRAPPLTRDQRACLLALRKTGNQSRSELAGALGDENGSVDETRITDAMNGPAGLKKLGLVTHTRKTGYVLTDFGRRLADQLSS
jgi:hypothetical protein